MEHPWVYVCAVGLWLCRLAGVQAPQIEDDRGDI
jgi:hypothetical protein